MILNQLDDQKTKSYKPDLNFVLISFQSYKFQINLNVLYYLVLKKVCAILENVPQKSLSAEDGDIVVFFISVSTFYSSPRQQHIIIHKVGVM